ncbi:MAG: FecR domain-containing protein, partial [Myxococcaceae bacterium]|nr:FecR domain-containing protein [Myxococcaceae bacterium]
MGEPAESALRRVVDSARAALTAEMPAPDVDALAARARARKGRRRVATGAVVALCLVGAWLFVRPTPQPAPLAFVVEGDAFADQGFVRTAPGQQATLRFSDGSAVALLADTRAQVTERRAAGATLRVSAGAVHVSVVHRHDTAWRVEPGPFVVHVTGTRFSAAWSASDEQALVELEEGSVAIEGPGLTTPVVLRPGQRFTGSVRPGAVAYAVESSSAGPRAGPPEASPAP